MKNATNNQLTHKVLGGLMLMTIGSILLLNNLGANIPNWILSWPMLLVGLGILNGVKHQFTKPKAFILIALGLLFLTGKLLYITFNAAIFIPVLLIALGVWILFKKHQETNVAYQFTHDEK